MLLPTPYGKKEMQSCNYRFQLIASECAHVRSILSAGPYVERVKGKHLLATAIIKENFY
jgi:hypothetical protein